jgi:hypothetical protein
MPKNQKKDDVHLDIVLEGEPHSSLSLWIPWEKEHKIPFVDQERVRLNGSVVRPKDSKYKRATIYIHSNAAMARATERLKDLGHVQTQDDNILLYAFWPSDTFANVLTLVCSGRVSELHAVISPIERRSAVVKWLTFETQGKASHEAEIDYWFVAKPRRKKNGDPSQRPLHQEGNQRAD